MDVVVVVVVVVVVFHLSTAAHVLSCNHTMTSVYNIVLYEEIGWVTLDT